MTYILLLVPILIFIIALFLPNKGKNKLIKNFMYTLAGTLMMGVIIYFISYRYFSEGGGLNPFIIMILIFIAFELILIYATIKTFKYTFEDPTIETIDFTKARILGISKHANKKYMIEGLNEKGERVALDLEDDKKFLDAFKTIEEKGKLRMKVEYFKSSNILSRIIE